MFKPTIHGSKNSAQQSGRLGQSRVSIVNTSPRKNTRGVALNRLNSWSKRVYLTKSLPYPLRNRDIFKPRSAIAVRFIRVIQQLVNQEPRLLTTQWKRTAAGSRSADGEFERRDEERRLFQELSKYYPLERYQSAWTRALLLSHSKHECDHSA